MNASLPSAAPRTVFSRREMQALRRMRANYAAYRDYFSAGEMARLRFYRWLYQAGLLTDEER